MTISSCREITVSTVVNKDGSFTRIVIVTGDSAHVLKSPDLPYPVDSTWEKEFTKDSLSDDNFILIYTKLYKNDDLINHEISRDTGWCNKINPIIKVKKRFGFFYSYLIYEESIKASNPLTLIDYHDYITSEDLLWISGKRIVLNSSDSAKLAQADKNTETYLIDAISEEIISAFKEDIAQLNNPAIPPDLAENYRDSMATKIYDWEFDSIHEFINYLAIWSDNDEVYKLKEINNAAFIKLDSTIQSLEEFLDMSNYKMTVEMPGVLTETNSGSTNGNIVSWNIDSGAFLFEDVTMKVESRVINKWMFIIAGVILLGLMAIIVLKSRK